jgi:hypothetical protein
MYCEVLKTKTKTGRHSRGSQHALTLLLAEQQKSLYMMYASLEEHET